MDELAKNILKTIIWFDLFEYPLTQEEIFNWYLSAYAPQPPINAPADRLLIFSEIEKLLSKNLIIHQNSFYFLPGREKIIGTRKERAIESERKLKRARRAAKFLGILPFIKAVVVCNVLGYKNAKAEDDIDFLIITAPKRIWATRWFATGFFKILNLRPNKKTIRDKFCFSFYLAEDGLNLEKIKLADDPYLTWWFTGLIPLYDAGGIFEKFIKENEWVEKWLPNNHPGSLSLATPPSKGGDTVVAILPFRRGGLRQRSEGGVVGLFLKKVWQFFAAIWPDKFYQKIQLWIMPRQLKELANKTQGVIISDQILKFHLVDRRAEFAEKYQKKLMEIIGN
ncbi:MAG: hypothetical protein PHT40_03785 [Patescibacteria group bacterium]|nr:hypothetical protein [Patescibacteria group bacterium]